MSVAVGTAQVRQARLMSLSPGGAVAGGTAFRLYFLIATEGATGCLSIVDAQGTTFDLWFKKGVPVFARTSSPSLGIGRYLLAQGVLDQDALARAQVLLREQGGDLIAVLCRSSGMDPNEAFRHLAGYGRAILARALAVETGSFGWRADAPAAPAGSAPLGDTWPLAFQAIRRLSGSDVVRRLGERLYLPVLRAGDGQIGIDDLRLGAQEARMVSSFDGTRSLAAIAAAAPPDEAESIFRLGLFLGEIGVVSFLGDDAADPIPRPERSIRYEFSSGPSPIFPAGPQAARRQASPPTRAAAAEPTPADPALLRLVAELPTKNHFEVLEIERNATTAEVKKAYFRLARLYHPDTAGAGNEGARRVKEQITARLNEAYEILGSDARRKEYLAELDAGVKGRVDVGSLLEAERVFQQGMLLVKARRFREAVGEFDKAIELDPSEGEFRAWRAFSHFCATPDKRQVEAECRADLAKALQASPNCAVAWLLSGRISNVLGDVPGAIEAYKACLALDKNHVEAMRELRTIEARKGK